MIYIRDFIMNNEKLIVKNFFSLQDIDVKLGKFNIFIGEQTSGKSLILKLIAFFRIFGMFQINEYQRGSLQVNEFILNQFKNMLNLGAGGDELSDHFFTEYKFGLHSIIIKKNIANNLEIIFSDDLSKIFEQAKKILQEKKQELSSINYDQITINELMANEILSIFNKYNISKYVDKNLFIPAQRSFLSSISSNVFRAISSSFDNNINSLNFGELLKLDYFLANLGEIYAHGVNAFDLVKTSNDKEVNETIAHIDKLANKILKGSFIPDSAGGFIQHENYTVRLNSASSGQQELLPMYIVLREYAYLSKRFPETVKEANLYIEEPEAHLYPSAQKSITELLVYITNVSGAGGLCITTHSPYILTVLNSLILASSIPGQKVVDPNTTIKFEDIQAYFINNGEARSLRDEEELIIADELDSVSEDNAAEFGSLLDLKYGKG